MIKVDLAKLTRRLQRVNRVLGDQRLFVWRFGDWREVSPIAFVAYRKRFRSPACDHSWLRTRTIRFAPGVDPRPILKLAEMPK